MCTQNRYRVGIVGIGIMGLSQVAQLLMNTTKWRVVGVADFSKLAFARFQQRYHDYHIPFFQTVTDLLEFEEMDAIVISTTAPSHVTIACDIINSNQCDVILIEKPISTSIAESRSLQQFIKDKGWNGRLGIDYQRRCSLMYQELRKIILNGELGRLVEINVNRVGTLSMNGSHFVDLAQFFTQSTPLLVQAKLCKDSLPDYRGSFFSDPCGYSRITFSNGALLELNFKQNSQQNHACITIACDKGKIHIKERETSVEIISNSFHKQIQSDKKGNIWFENTLEALITNKDNSLLCNLEESIINLETFIASFESNQMYGKEVKLPLHNKLHSRIMRIA